MSCNTASKEKKPTSSMDVSKHQLRANYWLGSMLLFDSLKILSSGKVSVRRV